MTLESITQNAGQLGETLDRTGQPLIEASKQACDSVRQEAGHLINSASEQIRRNPVPIVVGAVAFGVVIGCLIMSGRHTPTFQERYVDEPLDLASTTLNRLFGNLKFW